LPEVLIHRESAIGRVVISNPAKFNAMTTDMWAALPSCIAELDADSNIRVIVISGDGDRAFVSGADISQFGRERSDIHSQQRYKHAVNEAYLAPSRASKPVIAQIRGICMGGGLGLALGCDIRICSDDARFRMPAARLGLGYEDSGVQRFAALIGIQNTLDIFFTARTFDAQEALRVGYVSRIVPAKQLKVEVDALAGLITENAPLTLQAVKLSALNFLHKSCLSSTPEVKAAVEACNLSRDYLEGVLAFSEKRKPRFTGH